MEEEVPRGWRDPELVPLFVSTIQTHPSAVLHIAGRLRFKTCASPFRGRAHGRTQAQIDAGYFSLYVTFSVRTISPSLIVVVFDDLATRRKPLFFEYFPGTSSAFSASVPDQTPLSRIPSK